jgi:hypothetical protein
MTYCVSRPLWSSRDAPHRLDLPTGYSNLRMGSYQGVVRSLAKNILTNISFTNFQLNSHLLRIPAHMELTGLEIVFVFLIWPAHTAPKEEF